MMSKRIKYTDAVPNSIVTRYKEDNTQYLLDQVSRLTSENAMLKEKWLAQPEQTEQEPVAWIDDGCNGLIKQDTIRGCVMKLNELEDFPELGNTIVIDGIEYVKKQKPIKGGELEVWYSQHTWAMDKQEYIWGFRDAEKCYGIGGGE